MGDLPGPPERFDWVSLAVVLAIAVYLLGLAAVAAWGINRLF